MRVNTLEEAKSLYAEGKHLFETSMNLREWASNCEEFMKFVPQQDQAVNPKLIRKSLECIGI